MSTPNWTLFAAVVLFATAALLVLSRASARVITGERSVGDTGDESAGDGSAGEAPAASDAGEPPQPAPAPPVPTGGALLANVAFTHGLLGVALLALVSYVGIPLASLGIGPVSHATFAAGVGLGVGLYLASEVTTAVATRLGVEPDERLREYLAPTRSIEWAALLLVILPLIAGAEELLFRAILIGALGAGFGLPVWVLAIVSSVLFGLAHSAQGGAGVLVTATLGLVLAAAFVLTGSLAVVVLAHYTIDALEFVIREGVLG